MHLAESGEMYLETVHVLSKKGGIVRSVDVSEYMGYSKPSVSRAIGLLKSTISPWKFIGRTEDTLPLVLTAHLN